MHSVHDRESYYCKCVEQKEAGRLSVQVEMTVKLQVTAGNSKVG